MADRLTGGRSLIRRERMRGRVTFRAEGLEEALKYFNSWDNRLLDQLGRRITTASVIMQNHAVFSVLRHFVQRTGKFRKSFHLRIISKRGSGSKGAPLYGSVVGEVFSDHPAASIQDIGGIIRAKNKRLAVPLSEEARRRTPKDFGDRIRLSGHGYLVETIGFAETRFHYALRDSVRLKATRYLQDAVNRAFPEIVDVVGQGVNVTVRGR